MLFVLYHDGSSRLFVPPTAAVRTRIAYHFECFAEDDCRLIRALFDELDPLNKFQFHVEQQQVTYYQNRNSDGSDGTARRLEMDACDGSGGSSSISAIQSSENCTA